MPASEAYISLIEYYDITFDLHIMYSWNPNDPCFDGKDLVLECSTTKIEDKQVPGYHFVSVGNCFRVAEGSESMILEVHVFLAEQHFDSKTFKSSHVDLETAISALTRRQDASSFS